MADGFVFPPARQPRVAVAGHDHAFPVRRIFCVGRNYAEHAREMGHDPDREPPFFFGKPADALVEDGAKIQFSDATENLHYEGELVVAIGAAGHRVGTDDAANLIWGYAAGNDLTRRDLQAQAKAKGRPWDMAKGFDNSAVCGPIHPAQGQLPRPDARIRTYCNGDLVQSAVLANMIWAVDEVIVALSGLVALHPGDLIYTGTPAGVGPLQKGDTCRVDIDNAGTATVTLI